MPFGHANEANRENETYTMPVFGGTGLGTANTTACGGLLRSPTKKKPEDDYYETTVRRMVEALLEVYGGEHNETQFMDADAAVRSTFRPGISTQRWFAKARLRSERWRSAHGIMPRKPAKRPWLAEGISRSTWYRRGNRIGYVPNRIVQKANRIAHPNLSRAESLTRQAELAEAARCHTIAAGIIGEIAAEAFTA